MLTRRELVGRGTVLLGLAACGGARAVAGAGDTHDRGDDVSAVEDLMREHGLLERVLGAYAESARRLRAGDRDVRGAIRDAAAIARSFVEDYHERLEEQYVFPQFARTDLATFVTILRQQHDAGRGLTARIEALAASALRDEGDLGELADALDGYAVMFRPHVAREDTVLFPRLKKILGKGYDELGDRFEAEERARFGTDGFEGQVAKIAAVEAALGIDDLRIYTVTVHSPIVRR